MKGVATAVGLYHVQLPLAHERFPYFAPAQIRYLTFRIIGALVRAPSYREDATRLRFLPGMQDPLQVATQTCFNVQQKALHCITAISFATIVQIMLSLELSAMYEPLSAGPCFVLQWNGQDVRSIGLFFSAGQVGSRLA